MEDSLKKRYIIKLLASLVAGIINILLVAIVPKALGPVAFGQFSYLQQFFSQIIAFLDAGTSTAFFTKLSAKHERKELISFYFIFSFLLLIFLVLFLVTVDISGYMNFLLPNIPVNYVYLGLWFGFLTWFTQIYIKISDAYALTVSVEIIKILHKFLTLIILLYIIHNLAFNLTYYFYFHYLALLSFLLVLTILFNKKSILEKEIFFIKIAYRNLIKEFMDFSTPLLIFNTLAIVVALFDIWLLQTISGSTQTGFYGLAYAIAAMSFLFTGAMTPLLMREFSKSHAINNMEEIRNLFKRYVPMLYSIAGYFSIFMAFQSENLLLLFTDEKFKDAYLVLLIMAFYPLHQTYGQLNSSFLFATEQTRLYRNIGIISVIIGLIFTYFFLYVFEMGAVGFAWKMIIIQIISVNIQLYFNTKFLGIQLVPFLKHQVYTVLLFGMIGYVSQLSVMFIESPLLNLLGMGSIYTLLVFISVFTLPSLFSTNKEELAGMINKIKAKYYK